MAEKPEEKGTTRTADLLNEAMHKQNLSIRQVALKVDATYEHVRSILRGNVVPSKYMVKELSKSLGISLEELESASMLDRINLKFGGLPAELTGKNPELAPIERAWSKLSKAHKADIISIVQAYAKRDAER